jgi:signal transduction histidine kinase
MQLIQAAKLESIGTLAAGVAHEVKNPLQTILMGVDYLTNSLQGAGGNTLMALGDMRDAVKRADTIVRELLHFSAATHFDLQPEDLNAVVERALRLLNSELMAARIEVERALQEGLPPVWLDKGKMEQVLLNLFINALQAMAQNGTLTVRTRSGLFGDGLALSGPAHPHFKPGELVLIAEVQDTGPGIPEAHLARIFDPFFTTKPVGAGTGLGLSVVRKIMDFHEGAIEVRNSPRGGALVTLILRAASSRKETRWTGNAF